MYSRPCLNFRLPILFSGSNDASWDRVPRWRLETKLQPPPCQTNRLTPLQISLQKFAAKNWEDSPICVLSELGLTHGNRKVRETPWRRRAAYLVGIRPKLGIPPIYFFETCGYVDCTQLYSLLRIRQWFDNTKFEGCCFSQGFIIWLHSLLRRISGGICPLSISDLLLGFSTFRFHPG